MEKFILPDPTITRVPWGIPKDAGKRKKYALPELFLENRGGETTHGSVRSICIIFMDG